MSILGDIADPNVEKMFKKHWPWFVAGGLGFAYLAYTYLSSSSTAATSTNTTSTAAPTLDPTTAYNDQTQAQIASITANAQTSVAQIQAAQAVQTQNIVTNGENYQTLVNAAAVQTNSLAATAVQQNVQMAQALATGFGNYAISTANIATAESSAAANLGASNDAANGSNVLGSTLSGIGNIIGGINGSGPLGTIGGLINNVTSGAGGGASASGGINLGSIAGIAGLALA
jgi:hypothetical protein